jgi:prepilin-type N-terminal cleavage/methylation domain-containing protein
VSARTNQRGFTLVEVLISLTIFAILSVSLFAIVPNYLTVITRTNQQTDMTVESQGLLRRTVEELRYGAGVRQTNVVTDANAPAGGWNTGNASFVIIIAVPAVDTSRQYIIDAATGNPYNNELVYFKQNNKLYKRILANPSATGNSLVTTCPSASASPTCPADRLLSETLKTMTFTFYDQNNVVTTDPLLARSVKIDLQLEKDTFGQALTVDNSIRVALRNSFL